MGSQFLLKIASHSEIKYRALPCSSLKQEEQGGQAKGQNSVAVR